MDLPSVTPSVFHAKICLHRVPGGLIYYVLQPRPKWLSPAVKKGRRFPLVSSSACLVAWPTIRCRSRIPDWCVMSNHWHLVLWPEDDGELTAFMRWPPLDPRPELETRLQNRSSGTGIYTQGYFSSFPIQQDEHLLTVLRYVERNPVRAKLVGRAEQWRWGSCHVRQDRSHALYPLLTHWPVDRPARWLERVNKPQDEAGEKRIKEAIVRDRPVGDEAWIKRIATELDLSTPSARCGWDPPGCRKKKPRAAEHCNILLKLRAAASTPITPQKSVARFRFPSRVPQVAVQRHQPEDDCGYPRHCTYPGPRIAIFYILSGFPSIASPTHM